MTVLASPSFSTFPRPLKRRSRPSLAICTFLFLSAFLLLHYRNFELLQDDDDSTSSKADGMRVDSLHRGWRNGAKHMFRKHREAAAASSEADASDSEVGQLGDKKQEGAQLPLCTPQRDEELEKERELLKMREGELEREWEETRSNWEKGKQKQQERWDRSTVLNGPPMEHFRDNLRNDKNYLTTWSNAGFTNEFMGYVNMIYLATLTDRVPIIPPFAPDHHISFSAGVIHFGDIFDLEHLRSHLQMPILEWRDIKVLPDPTSSNPYPYAQNPSNPSSLKPEGLGCWSTRKLSEGEPIRAENVVNHIGVDVSYTRVPPWTRLKPDDKEGDHVVLPQLAALIYPRTSSSSSPIPPPTEFRHLYMAPAPQGHAGLPESQMACFDTMYYSTSGAEVFEWRFGWSPVWRTVGKYLRFKEDSTVMRVARSYLRGLLGSVRDEKENEGDSVEEDHESNGEQEGDMLEEVPPFIAVHVRRGDFRNLCRKAGQPVDEDCYPPLSIYHKHVEDIKEELFKERGIVVKHVLLMSDETSPSFYATAASYSWLHIDHDLLQTEKQFGGWYAPLIDIIVQSMAVGFVGTEDSTFSLVSQRRVVDWRGGIVRSVGVNSAI